MMYPAMLHLPVVVGALIGGLLALWLWDTDPVLAVLVGMVLTGLGIWASIKLSDYFYRGN